MDLRSTVDHTLLSPDAGKSDVNKLVDEAIEHRFRGVCVNPQWIGHVSDKLSGTDIKTVSVVDFPLGASLTDVRIYEAEKVVDLGADEIDVVINLGLFKSGMDDEVLRDLHEIVESVHPLCRVKVIIEAPLLCKDEIKRVSEIVEDSGADFIKSGTGTRGPVTVEQVEIMHNAVSIPVKAAGGIRERIFALELIEAGASILGTSSGISLIQD